MAFSKMNALFALVYLLFAASAHAQPLRGSDRGQDQGMRPDRNGQKPDGLNGRPNGRPGGDLLLPPNPVLAAASAACQLAANSTSAVFTSCMPAAADNSTTQADREARKTIECSDACNAAIEAYWTALEEVCGNEPVLEFRSRNGSVPSYNITAAELAPAALLKQALGCTKDASGSYCPGGFGARPPKGDHKLEASHRGGERGNNSVSRLPKTKGSGTDRPRPSGTRTPHTHTDSRKARATRGPRPTDGAGDLHKRHGGHQRPGPLGSAVKSIMSRSAMSRATGLPPKSLRTVSRSARAEATRPPRASGSARPPRPTGSPRPKVKRDDVMDTGRPQFNATICDECANAALEVITSFSEKYPEQNFFGHAFGGAASWDEVEADVNGRCEQIEQAEASKTASRVESTPAA